MNFEWLVKKPWRWPELLAWNLTAAANGARGLRQILLCESCHRTWCRRDCPRVREIECR